MTDHKDVDTMNRRSFLKVVAGVTATGVLLPDDEVVRRFWRGWRPAAHVPATVSKKDLYDMWMEGGMIYWNAPGRTITWIADREFAVLS